MKSFSTLFFTLLMLALSGNAHGADTGLATSWSPLMFDVQEVVDNQDKNAVFVRSRDRWYKLFYNQASLSKQEVEGPLAVPEDQYRLPDGYVAEVPNSVKNPDILKAWYSVPTDNYTHTVLGDGLEGSMLRAVLADGSQIKVQLPLDKVFEDRTPRLVDLNGDGKVEIVTIRSNIVWGSRVVVYGIVKGQLEEVAYSEWMGRAYRWLNIAGIEDYDGDGDLEIAIVKMPHLLGELQILKLRGLRLRPIVTAKGYSNHKYGLRAMSLSTNIISEGRPLLLIPNFERNELHALRYQNNRMAVIWTREMNSPISGGLAHLQNDKGTLLFTVDELGQLLMKYEAAD